MASLIELLGSQQAVDEAKAALVEAMETGTANALGKFEFDEAKILAPLEALGNRLLTRFDESLKAQEDRIVAKVLNLRITQGDKA